MASRNDPCPCGSGKKYKACHMHADEIAARTAQVLGPADIARAEAEAVEAARRAPVWEADVAPLMGPFGDTGEPGALTMVMAGGLILVGEVLGRRPGGLQARAGAVLNAVTLAGRKAGVLPARLHVRDGALADALRDDAEARGIAVSAAPLTELDAALEDSLAHLMESVAGGAASQPFVWAETEASDEALADFHAAAAAYHRAAPWRTMDDSDALLLTFPGAAEPWAAAVMGSAGIQQGLALYSDPGDLVLMMESDEGGVDGFASAMRGMTLSVSYDRAADLPRSMRREVAAGKWELASPDAYPALLGMGVPGRRITAELLGRAALACRAVAAFAEAGDVPVPWRDPSTGVEVDFAFDEDEDDDSIHLPWASLRVSRPVGPAGPKADPEAVLRLEWDAVVAGETARLKRFVAWLGRQKPSKAARERLVRTAEMWMGMLSGYGIPSQSATEYDLRIFLYAYAARLHVPTKVVAKHLTRSLARIFEFYADHEGIEYPWAGDVLDELDVIAAGEDDVRDVLEGANELFVFDMLHRVLRPVAEVAGSRAGWSMVYDDATVDLREELHRRWLLWHDEVVRGGITEPNEVREVLTGRQRQWENTPHPALGGRTPKQALIEAERNSHSEASE